MYTEVVFSKVITASTASLSLVFRKTLLDSSNYENCTNL